MSKEIWVLGGTGRTGRAIAANLAERDVPLVLVGRDAQRLAAAADPLHARVVVADNLAGMAAAIRRERPSVVVNTVGPFHDTAVQVAEAALPSGNYVDLANDVGTLTTLLGRDGAARKAGHTIVTGAGFGVTATESLVTHLMTGQSAAQRVRVDMIPSMASTSGVVGEALARSLVEGLPDIPGGGRFAGRRITGGVLAPAPIGGEPESLVTPDGDKVTTALMPLGEMLAAQRATSARSVSSASSEAPSGALTRLLLPMMLSLLNIGALRRFAGRSLAGVKTPDRAKPREHSWAHARIEWDGGDVREGWLRVPEAGQFTVSVAAEVAFRLLNEAGQPGAFTPAALFGSSLAESCDGYYLAVQERARA